MNSTIAGRQSIICTLLTALCVLAGSTVLVTPAAGEAMLLSDQFISRVTGKAVLATNIEESERIDAPQHEVYPAFWGDDDGLAGTTADAPGYVVVNFPYEHFQWKEFKYSFPDIESADAFKSSLASQTNISPTATTVIKSSPNADSIFDNDGTAPRVNEVIVTTNKQVGPYLVHNFQGTVIPEKVRFELTFDDETSSGYDTKNKSDYIRKIDSAYGRPYRSMTYTTDGIGPDNNYDIQKTRYGAVLMEKGTTGAEPIRRGGKDIVPAHQPYLINTLSADVEVYSPQLGVAIGLAPAGEPYQPRHLALEGQKNFPDLNRYQELGHLNITGLRIKVSGGVPIYLYHHTEPDWSKADNVDQDIDWHGNP
ncbi:MAG: hypothetical protein ACLFS7_06375 [Desulfosudaceae bacterium]